jgi:class 3 adenylate cyclase
VAKHGGEGIKGTGDGFFLAFADPDAAIDAAIAVQRRLAEQRQEHGFAPAVRIGLHTAEASRSGLDYVGLGVHAAARIGSAAQTGEILASAATLAAARRSTQDMARRTLRIRGMSASIEVAALPWR